MQKAALSRWLVGPRRSEAAVPPPRAGFPFSQAAVSLLSDSTPFSQSVGVPPRDSAPFFGGRVSPPRDSLPFFQEEPDLVQTGSYFEICSRYRVRLAVYFQYIAIQCSSCILS